MSSNARKLLPAALLSHPAITGLIEAGLSAGSLTPDQVRLAIEQAEVAPRHLKPLLAHLSAQGISFALPVPADRRAVAATSTRKAATAKKVAAPPAKKAAAPTKESSPA
ncbi:MAG: RNA polymerase sigma factor, partial [Nocardioides sp.]